MAQQPRQKSEYETFKRENKSKIRLALQEEGTDVNPSTIAAKAKEMFAAGKEETPSKTAGKPSKILEDLAHHVSVLLQFEASVKASLWTYDTETEEYTEGDPYKYLVDWPTVSCALKMLLFPDEQLHKDLARQMCQMFSESDDELNDRERELLTSFRDRLKTYIGEVPVSPDVGRGLRILLDDILEG